MRRRILQSYDVQGRIQRKSNNHNEPILEATAPRTSAKDASKEIVLPSHWKPCQLQSLNGMEASSSRESGVRTRSWTIGRGQPEQTCCRGRRKHRAASLIIPSVPWAQSPMSKGTCATYPRKLKLKGMWRRFVQGSQRLSHLPRSFAFWSECCWRLAAKNHNLHHISLEAFAESKPTWDKLRLEMAERVALKE